MAENLILSDLESITSVPLNLVLDDYFTDAFTPAAFAKFYYRPADLPEKAFVYLGQVAAGFPFEIPLDIGSAGIVISMIGVSSSGVASETDPRAGVQYTFIPDPTLGILTDGGNALTDLGDVLVNS